MTILVHLYINLSFQSFILFLICVYILCNYSNLIFDLLFKHMNLNKILNWNFHHQLHKIKKFLKSKREKVNKTKFI